MTDKKQRAVRLGTTAVKAIVFLFGWAVLVSVIPIPDCENPAVWRFFAELIPFVCIAAMTALFFVIERGRITVGSVHQPLRMIFLSCVFGIVWIDATAGILAILGVIRIEGMNQIEQLWLWILSAWINTVMQELLVRGYLYQMIKKNYTVGAATVVTTALFTIAHGGAFEAGILPVLNILSMSLMITALLEYTGTLCAPICVHFVWNSIGGILLGGVSLADDYPHLFHMTFTGNPILTGGTCKMEGSIVALILSAVFTLGIIWMMRNKATEKSR